MYFLAGPNGSGKSTIFKLMQEKTVPIPFINADLIGNLFASAPAADVLAQSIADVSRNHFVKYPSTFATETVFSDEVGAKMEYLKLAAASGFRVVLIASWLPSAAASIARVRHRVANGGHAVPEEKLPRRYMACMKNLREAFSFVETVMVFDNSGPFAEGPQLAATISKGVTMWKSDTIPRGIQELLPNGPGAAS